MLSFELSAIDLILAIAVIILLILQMRKPSVKTSTEEQLLVDEEYPSKKPIIEDMTTEKERKTLMSTQPQTDSTKCPYGFGYLRKLDKDAHVPDECLGCSRVIECSAARARTPVEETTETSVETPVEEIPVEEATEAESVSEEVSIEESLETPTEETFNEEVTDATNEEVSEIPPTEEAVVTLPETPVEETLEEEAPSEEIMKNL